MYRSTCSSKGNRKNTKILCNPFRILNILFLCPRIELGRSLQETKKPGSQAWDRLSMFVSVCLQTTSKTYGILWYTLVVAALATVVTAAAVVVAAVVAVAAAALVVAVVE